MEEDNLITILLQIIQMVNQVHQDKIQYLEHLLLKAAAVVVMLVVEQEEQEVLVEALQLLAEQTLNQTMQLNQLNQEIQVTTVSEIQVVVMQIVLLAAVAVLVLMEETVNQVMVAQVV